LAGLCTNLAPASIGNVTTVHDIYTALLFRHFYCFDDLGDAPTTPTDRASSLAPAAAIAKVLFLIFLILPVISFISRALRGGSVL
jgi:hypothetical protein